ncbi:MAG: elongation factor G [Kiritimatiellae bacterium]|nr:elongation factor G [Kiritimatiellia bacterium]
MKDIPIANVRNFALVGHTGSGKTTLLDALLYKLGVNDRLGNPGDGTSMADWTDEEKARKISIWAKPFDALWKPKGAKPVRFVMLDTPGYADFFGQVVAATRVADAAVLTIDATSGIQVGTVRAWKQIDALGLPRAIVVTGLDKENADFDGTLASIQEHWGDICQPATIPADGGKSITNTLASPSEKLVELAAESSDELLEKFFGGEELTADELAAGLRASVLQGKFVPVFAALPLKSAGLDELLEGLAKLLPSPLDRPAKDADGNEVNPAADAPFVAQVWRNVNDPFVGQMTIARIWGGTLKADAEVFNSSKDGKERAGTIYLLKGKAQDTAPEASAGDIIALAKLKVTTLNDTLCAPGGTTKMPEITFPKPVCFFAVTPKNQGDEDKLGQGLRRVADDDPTIHVGRNDETHELIISGVGDVQIAVAMERMKARSKVEVTLSTPKVAYKETVTAKGDGHYKHKKQSGGRGQYGEVYIHIQPKPEGQEEWFIDQIVGTSIPRNFLPAIQKGLQEAMQRGVIAGYPVEDTMIGVYDGSYHEVDSSEIAFKIAARGAFKDGMMKCKPVLREPIMTLRVTIPQEFMGACQGDLTHKRGRILGMETEEGMQVLIAEVPQAEIFSYSSELRSMTGGRGSFTMEFARYDIVPSNVAQKIIAEAAKNKQDDEDE